MESGGWGQSEWSQWGGGSGVWVWWVELVGVESVVYGVVVGGASGVESGSVVGGASGGAVWWVVSVHGRGQ